MITASNYNVNHTTVMVALKNVFQIWCQQCGWKGRTVHVQRPGRVKGEKVVTLLCTTCGWNMDERRSSTRGVELERERERERES